MSSCSLLKAVRNITKQAKHELQHVRLSRLQLSAYLSLLFLGIPFENLCVCCQKRIPNCHYGLKIEVMKEMLTYITSDHAFLVGVHLFYPWLPVDFCIVVLLSVKHAATLDKTKESRAQGEPL